MIFRGLLAAAAALTIAGAARATTFDFQFFDTQTGTPIPVGTGAFSTSANLTTPGLYVLSALPDFSMTYSFNNGDVYTQNNTSPTFNGIGPTFSDYGVALDVEPFASTVAMSWALAPPGSGGPGWGYLFLQIFPNYPRGPGESLNFFPGGSRAYLEGAMSPNFAGDYLAVLAGAPEPSAWALMILGLGVLGFTLRRRPALAAA